MDQLAQARLSVLDTVEESLVRIGDELRILVGAFEAIEEPLLRTAALDGFREVLFDLLVETSTSRTS